MYISFHVFLILDSRKDKTEKHLNSSTLLTLTEVSKYTGHTFQGYFLGLKESNTDSIVFFLETKTLCKRHVFLKF